MRIAILVLSILVSVSGLAQKIKYKDVFGLLSTRQYEAAEPFLKKYLAENDDNPNAFLYMGIIYQEKSMKDDILRSTQVALNHMDSAIYFYDKAYKSIDEKELKRNKDYYAMYFRRDLRTGEYGVKLSDVQFELEKSSGELKERIDKVKMVKHYFTQAEQLYQRSNELFISIQALFPGEQELYLRSDDNTVASLNTLSVRFDSCTKAFEHYKISLGNIQKSGYNQVWNLVEIKDFKKDGVAGADFYKADLQVWDYKNFATKAIAIIEKEVKPIREKLVRYDIEINKLRGRLSTDSVSVKSDLTKLVDNLLGEKLQRFDEDPLPLSILGVKVAELEYLSTIVENRKEGSTDDVFVKLNLVKSEIKALSKLDSLVSGLAKRNIDEEAMNYSNFVTTTYNSISLLKSYVRAEKDFVEREKKKKNHELDLRSQALQWLVVGNDSIPLDINYSQSIYKPLLVDESKYTTGIISSGTESTNGYFFTITPSRKPDINVNFPVDAQSLNESHLPSLKAIATSDQGNNIYFVMMYSAEKVNDKFPATVAKIYRSDGLSWSNNLLLDFIPTEIQYLQDAADLLIKSDSELIVLLDKSGKIKQ